MTIPTLSDLIADGAVCNVMGVIRWQLEERIRQVLKANIADPDYLQRPFESQHGWITSRPYSVMRFKFHYSALTLLELCNAIEIFHGVSIQYLFMEELTKQVKETVGKVLEQHVLSLEVGECEKSAKSYGTLN